MKVIVAGTRTFDSARFTGLVAWALTSLDWPVEEIVSGAASGIDTAGENWAKINRVPIKHFFPDWDAHGKAAGPLRNEEMAKYADALILVWDGHSAGSADMRDRARRHGLPVFEVVVRSANKMAPGERSES